MGAFKSWLKQNHAAYCVYCSHDVDQEINESVAAVPKPRFKVVIMKIEPAPPDWPFGPATTTISQELFPWGSGIDEKKAYKDAAKLAQDAIIKGLAVAILREATPDDPIVPGDTVSFRGGEGYVSSGSLDHPYDPNGFKYKRP